MVGSLQLNQKTTSEKGLGACLCYPLPSQNSAEPLFKYISLDLRD